MDDAMNYTSATMKDIIENSDRLDAEVFITSADGSTAKHISDIEDLVAKGVSVIWAMVSDDTAVNAGIEYAEAHGVKVIVGRTVTTDAYSLYWIPGRRFSNLPPVSILFAMTLR